MNSFSYLFLYIYESFPHHEGYSLFKFLLFHLCLHIPLLCLENVSLFNSFILLFKTFPRHAPCFPTSITLQFSSFTSSSTSGKIVSSSRVSSYRNSSSLYLTIKSSSFSPEFLELFSGDSSSSIRTLPLVPLTLLPCQFIFFL
jgi:hypothetical protein